jgi:hypothetical protein
MARKYKDKSLHDKFLAKKVVDGFATNNFFCAVPLEGKKTTACSVYAM